MVIKMRRVILSCIDKKLDYCLLKDAKRFFKAYKKDVESDYEYDYASTEEDLRKEQIGEMLYESKDQKNFKDVAIEIDDKTWNRWQAAKYLNDRAQADMQRILNEFKKK